MIEENSSPAEEIDKILYHVNLLTVDFYQQVLQENLPQIVMDFQAPLPNYDVEVVQMYKKELLRLVSHPCLDLLTNFNTGRAVGTMRAGGQIS